MKHSKQTNIAIHSDYLKTIKKNHKIETHIDKKEGEPKTETIFRHVKAMGNIQRLSGIFTIQPYTVALHCYYTAILFQDIADKEEIEFDKTSVDFILRHDIVETITGDLLLPVKIHSESTKNKWEEIEKEIVMDRYKYLHWYTDAEAEYSFNSESFNLFKACDLFELYLFCLSETYLGNNSNGIWTVIRNCENLLPEFDVPYIKGYVNNVKSKGSIG